MYYQKENFNGTYDFRSRFHHGFIIESHIHEYSEILYCQEGECEISINGKSIRLSDNEFVFIPPNYIHRYDCVDVNVICAVFSNDYIPLFFKSIKGKKLIEGKLDAGELKRVFEKLPTLDKTDTVLITAYLNLICDKVLKEGEYKKATSSEGILYQKVISYIADNYRENLSLNRVAKIFGYNVKYLSSAIHSSTGIHFSDLIAMYRVEYAKELLIKSSLSVAEIGMECGYSAINSFNRQFKKMTHMTPTKFRQLYSVITNLI